MLQHPFSLMQMGGYHKLWKGVVFNMKIGFIGLGRMGRGVCENFVKKGHDVAVYDVSADAMEYFRGKAELASNPADLFERSEAVLLSLPSSVQVEAMCDTFLSCGVKDKIVIDLSTSYPLSTKKLHEAFKKHGGILLDAPLMGCGGKECEKG